MKTTPYQIRRMSRLDLKTAIGWASREGWNPGLYDLDPFYDLDPDGYFLGLLGDRPVASISCLRYSSSYGFLGFYIVDPGLRGQGLGLALWSAALKHVDGCVVGLDGVVAQQENYRRSGFELAWHNVRYQGRGQGPGRHDARIVPLSAVPFDVLAAYDRAFHPEPRSAFLRAWIALPNSRALGWVDAGELRGYGVIRACVDGHKIAPLCADSPGIAEALLGALCASVPSHDPVFIDVPQALPQSAAWAKSLGMEPTFPTARMYRGPAPSLDLSRLYGLTALEVG
ncbi:MAG: GNAT family N-acetyltransferase [Burkholderiales bacterium]|nr:MAG: GNAT family N-acetyltransferase [Burkholderiales bacterium]